MAETMIGYLKKYGNRSLEQMPFNEVDSLVLCQLSYLKYDGIVCDVRGYGPPISIQEIAEHADFDKLFADERFEENNRALFREVLSAKRYGNMRLHYYINTVEKDWEIQFSAVTFLLENRMVYVAFRGTDETLVGWKEDFNMAYLCPVPAQEHSAKYLNMVAGKLRGSFYVGGHSKGGNLAVYSAMKCLPQVQERILKIYNMDGPGFRPEFLKDNGYERIEGRIVKILPRSSLVGMVFEQGNHYQVIESNKFGLAQHDPYNWRVKEGHFIPVDDMDEVRRFMDSTLNEWLLSLEEEKLRVFVETFYQIITASRADNLIDFAADWKKSVSGIMGALKEVDEESALMIKGIFKSLLAIGKAKVWEEIFSWKSERNMIE